MPLLEVVEPEEMYDFAREHGLLADASQPPPSLTRHRLPPVDVFGPEGLITRLDDRRP